MGADYVGLKDRIFSQEATMNWPMNFQLTQTGFCSYHKIVPSFIAAVKNIMLARPLCFKHLTLLCHLNYPSKVTFSNECPLMSCSS